jgi:hypothetical protein
MNDDDDAHKAPPGCVRLIGASLWSRTGSAVEYLLSLRSDLARANEAQGLRCALLHTNGWLVQWFEGTAAAVDDAWDSVQKNAALRGARLLHRSVGEAQLTHAVHIATLHGKQKATDAARRLHGVERQAALGWSAEPNEIWQSLSAPCQFDQADLVAPVTRRHVVAITSEASESIDLLLAIAERCGSAVSYQRFAEGAAGRGDVGAAYADVIDGRLITRLQALSRGALSQRLVRLGLSHLQCLVLLVGSRASANLVESVAGLLADVPACLSVQLVGTDRDALEQAADSLRRLPGLQFTQNIIASSRRERLEAVLALLADAQAAYGRAAGPEI